MEKSPDVPWYWTTLARAFCITIGATACILLAGWLKGALDTLVTNQTALTKEVHLLKGKVEILQRRK